jgi:S1/P1 Nuclease
MRRIFCVLTIVLVASSQAFAWSDAGHKIIASIAFSRLTEDERTTVVGMLTDHPRFSEDFYRKLTTDIAERPDGGQEWIFQQASVWPDIARGFRGDDAKYHHLTWHYINLPHFLNDADKVALTGHLKVNVSLDPPDKPTESMNAIQAIRLSRAMLADRKGSRADRAIMLTWLFHLVGDIHQPLHSSALFSQHLFREGDRGGNRILTKQHGNLHSLWDSFPGGRVEFRHAHQEALKLMADPDLAKLGERSAAQLDEKDWLEESRELAVNVVYGPEVIGYLRNMDQEGAKELQPITLEADYLKAGGKVCNQRVVQAGYRLAAVLTQIVD